MLSVVRPVLTVFVLLANACSHRHTWRVRPLLTAAAELGARALLIGHLDSLPPEPRHVISEGT